MVTQWWGCSLAGAVSGQRDEEGHPVFTLHYDAYDAFEEVDHNVSFVDKYRLIHLEDGAEMMWKKEGEEMDREAVMASLADEAVDLQEVSVRNALSLVAGRSRCWGVLRWRLVAAKRLPLNLSERRSDHRHSGATSSSYIMIIASISSAAAAAVATAMPSPGVTNTSECHLHAISDPFLDTRPLYSTPQRSH